MDKNLWHYSKFFSNMVKSDFGTLVSVLWISLTKLSVLYFSFQNETGSHNLVSIFLC